MENKSAALHGLSSGDRVHSLPDDSVALRSLNAGQANSDLLALGDPSVVVTLAVRCGVMGRVTRQGIPEAVRNGLRHHALRGEPACQLVLEWLDGLMLSDIKTAERNS